jgi:hypothetical protein
MVSTATWATLALLLVTASFPFYLYGAWIIVDAEVVTWDVLVHHLSFVVPGVVINTIPVAFWMLPRLFRQLQGINVLHAFLGLQAYALLLFGLTGIVRILQAKRTHGLYEDPDKETSLSELHPKADDWRRNLRVGVFGYVGFWILAYLTGVFRFVTGYLLS